LFRNGLETGKKELKENDYPKSGADLAILGLGLIGFGIILIYRFCIIVTE